MFLGTPDGGFRRLGAVFLHSGAAYLEPSEEGIGRIIAYFRSNAGYGALVSYRVSAGGIEESVLEKAYWPSSERNTERSRALFTPEQQITVRGRAVPAVLGATGDAG